MALLNCMRFAAMLMATSVLCRKSLSYVQEHCWAPPGLTDKSDIDRVGWCAIDDILQWLMKCMHGMGL